MVAPIAEPLFSNLELLAEDADMGVDELRAYLSAEVERRAAELRRVVGERAEDVQLRVR